jgi:hypothetical protein
VSQVGRRLLRLLEQSSIRLPRRLPEPGELNRGDRIQIGSGVWRIRGRLLLLSGSWAFLLEPLTGLPEGTSTARLLAPAKRPGPWALIRGEARFDVPAECVIVYPAGDRSSTSERALRRGCTAEETFS